MWTDSRASDRSRCPVQSSTKKAEGAAVWTLQGSCGTFRIFTDLDKQPDDCLQVDIHTLCRHLRKESSRTQITRVRTGARIEWRSPVATRPHLSAKPAPLLPHLLIKNDEACDCCQL
ncbi:hypothetical protein AAFF_G00049310 [Aldrovandia affinis]|uniref:Uncharacterized protein n=1 Tax=Aldrovandia affinis TaxID=143900 RepID=A0AAD7S177_9TELE|nr:hypothetical protein AAFF_G00049310 [Aldrovandia affinis]